MKKIMFFAAMLVAMTMASCGSKTDASADTTDVVADSVEVVTDSVAVDSVEVVDTVAVDAAL